MIVYTRGVGRRIVGVLTAFALVAGSFIGGVVLSLATAAPAQAAVLGDDYPSNLKNAAIDALVDPWLFYNRECTSFVAWRLNNANGVGFTNYYKGPHWGNAISWGPAARSAGLTVDSNPTVGAVAWWNTGTYGHVAWVAAVSGGNVTIEEYNYNWDGKYHTRTIAATGVSGFIHVKDLPGAGPEGRPYFLSNIQANGDAYAKEGLGGRWVNEYPGIVQTAVASDPVNGLFYGALTADGNLLGKQGIGGQWVSLAGDVRQFSLASDAANGLFVAMVKTDGSVFGKQGMGGTWIALTGDAKQVAISSDSRNGLFVGVVHTDGSVDGKQGMGGTWVRLIGGSSQIAVTSDPSNGVFYTTLQTDGSVFGKQGMSGTWIALAGLSLQIATPGSGPRSAVSLTLSSSPIPTISGLVRVGSTLTASAGDWRPSPVHLSYQWLRGGAVIAGATAGSYVLTPADLGARISVKVTGSRAGYTTVSRISTSTGAVATASGVQASISGATPKISGKAKIGKTLVAKAGVWTPSSVELSYQWLRNGKPIAGASGARYKVVKADKRKKLSVRVTGSLSGAKSVTKTSKKTARVK